MSRGRATCGGVFRGRVGPLEPFFAKVFYRLASWDGRGHSPKQELASFSLHSRSHVLLLSLAVAWCRSRSRSFSVSSSLPRSWRQRDDPSHRNFTEWRNSVRVSLCVQTAIGVVHRLFPYTRHSLKSDNTKTQTTVWEARTEISVSTVCKPLLELYQQKRSN